MNSYNTKGEINNPQENSHGIFSAISRVCIYIYNLIYLHLQRSIRFCSELELHFLLPGADGSETQAPIFFKRCPR